MTSDEKKRNVIDIHNKMAEDYSNEYFNDTLDHEDILNFLYRLNGKKVLDAGCGDGKDVGFMIKHGFDPLGVDFTPNFIKIANRKVPNGKFAIADISDLSIFEDDTFDGIFAGYSLQHMPTDLLEQTLRGFSRILKPDGQILILVQAGELGEQMIDEPLLFGEKLYINFLSEETINKLLLNTEFTPVISKTLEERISNAPSSSKVIIQAINQKLKLTNDISHNNGIVR